MKKLLFILLILSAFNLNVYAQEEGGETYPRFTYGLEWGYIATLNTYFHNNYFAPEGFRVDEHGMTGGMTANAEIYLNVGWNLSPLWNLSILAGYAGVGDLHNIIPVSVRGTRYFGQNTQSDRWFAFGDFGSGFALKLPVQEILTGRIGGGYQISLSRNTKLSFMVSARATYTHTIIYYDRSLIPMSDINRNNALAGAVSAGIGLSF